MFKNFISMKNFPKKPPKIIGSYATVKHRNCQIDYLFTSIFCERTFSLCHRICIPIRGKISEKFLNTIIFLNKNLEL